jgi:L-2-hydroxyglutarate oxidase LhgO
VDGQVKIGPTATPALWREQYGWREGFSVGELAQTTTGLARLMAARHSTVRAVAPKEATKYLRRLLVAQAKQIVDGVRPENFRQWGRPGIRAQLVDLTDQSLVSDFIFETQGRSLHVLNAVSPAFTSSLTFASLVVDELASLN